MIIGLCGAQGSGKDTVANILVAKLVWIVRPECEPGTHLSSRSHLSSHSHLSSRSHLSETVDLSDSVDITLVNNSTIEALEQFVFNLLIYIHN